MRATGWREMDAASALTRGVAAEFRRRLAGEYVPRIRRCVEMLGDDACWRKPAPNCNSVANLLQHLRGNVTQWILVTFGHEQDHRDRSFEFASSRAEVGESAAQLLQRLAEVVTRACAAVDALDAEELLRARTIQRQFTETGLSAVLHVMEHFAGHAGQIYAFTKQTTGQDLRFYDL
ncbi:MAG: DUF664 domain-containing protein [Planctomycetes bacterium]|nr:DUF664 domain-containing protein [Planctomycetota bacterium]